MIIWSMLPKFKVQTLKSGLKSARKWSAFEGRHCEHDRKNPNDANQKQGETKSYYSLEWIKHPEKMIQGVTIKLLVKTKTDV